MFTECFEELGTEDIFYLLIDKLIGYDDRCMVRFTDVLQRRINKGKSNQELDPILTG